MGHVQDVLRYPLQQSADPASAHSRSQLSKTCQGPPGCSPLWILAVLSTPTTSNSGMAQAATGIEFDGSPQTPPVRGYAMPSIIAVMRQLDMAWTPPDRALITLGTRFKI